VVEGHSCQYQGLLQELFNVQMQQAKKPETFWIAEPTSNPRFTLGINGTDFVGPFIQYIMPQSPIPLNRSKEDNRRIKFEQAFTNLALNE
jgi:hypothetical protein